MERFDRFALAEPEGVVDELRSGAVDHALAARQEFGEAGVDVGVFGRRVARLETAVDPQPRAAVGQAEARPVDDVPVYELGRVLSFDSGGDGRPFLGGGWFYPEDFGTWSQGTPSRVVLPLAEPVDRDVELELQLIGYTTPYLPPMRAELAANDVCVARMRFPDPAKQIAIVRTVIPAAAVRGWNRLELTFIARHPVTPAEGRAGSDLRRIALALVKLGTA